MEFYRLSHSDMPIADLAPTELEIELDGDRKEALVWEAPLCCGGRGPGAGAARGHRGGGHRQGWAHLDLDDDE
eukprot:10084612-Lingulodinium_polyedra.AAC.1